MADVVQRIREILDPILASLGLSLWDLEFQRQGPKWLLRVYIDRESGTTLNDCETVSRDLGTALDVEDIISHAYTLEVSSPGLDRTLSRPEHFVRFTGKTVKIKTYESIEGQKVFQGKLIEGGGSVVKIETETGLLEFRMDQVAKASLVVEF